MSLQTLIHAGPVKANELFVKLSGTSDGAVKTRERLFAALKAELERHVSLEEQHLFPILRRNAETEELVTDAVKDNEALRAKLAELEALPKNDEAFSERVKELQKTFRQHAQDEKQELLPAVQLALSEEQAQSEKQERSVAEIGADVAEAELAGNDEAEALRARARQEGEEAEQQEAAERAQKALAEQISLAEQEVAAERAQVETEERLQNIARTVGQTATPAAQTGVLRFAENAATGARHVGPDLHGAASAYSDAMQTIAPNLRPAVSLFGVAISAATEIHLVWVEWIGQTTRAGTQMSQDLLQAAKDQQRFVANGVQGWIEHNASIMRITMHITQAGLRP